VANVNRQLELIILLNDLELTLQELTEDEANPEEKLGFKVPKKQQIVEMREEIVRQLDPDLYRAFERVWNRYGKAVASVQNGICYGCFESLPIKLVARKGKNEEVASCPHCGKFLYWLDDHPA
jgi:predicted  nucleic acid-binding Zn-ribbon protein